MTGSLVRRDERDSMTRPDVVDFADHNEFHLTVGRSALGGAAGGLVAAALSSVVGYEVPILLLATTTGALAAIALTGKKWLRAALGGAAGLAGGVMSMLAGGYPLFAAALLGGAVAPILARGESLKRKLVTGAMAGALGSAGLYVAQWLHDSGALNGIVPAPIATAAAGAAVGLFFGLSSAPKHIARAKDPVEKAYRDALSIKDGELHDILARALSIHQSVKSDLALKKDEPTIQKLGHRVGELAMRVLTIADQCRRIERDLSSAPAFELEERIEQLRRKADSATDAAARETYLSAVESLDGQRRAFDVINRGRERVVARLHANVALLEKVRYSLLHMRSADAERVGGESSPLLDAVEELSRELDATSSAIGEVFGRPASQLEPAAPAAQLAPVLDSRNTQGE